MPYDVVATAGVPLAQAPPPFGLPSMAMQLLWHPRRTPDARHRFLRERVRQAVRHRLG